MHIRLTNEQKLLFTCNITTLQILFNDVTLPMHRITTYARVVQGRGGGGVGSLARFINGKKWKITENFVFPKHENK